MHISFHNQKDNKVALLWGYLAGKYPNLLCNVKNQSKRSKRSPAGVSGVQTMLTVTHTNFNGGFHFSGEM